MRRLYKDFYQNKKRGFTDIEFQHECETLTGTSLAEIFEYASNVNPINYPKYFAYAGLSIDTITRLLPGGYLGAIVANRDSMLLVREVESGSPALTAGIKRGDQILALNGVMADKESFNAAVSNMGKGYRVEITIQRNNEVKHLAAVLSVKHEKSFAITPLPHPNSLQMKIYKSWLRE